MKHKLPTISSQLKKWLLITAASLYLITTVLTIYIQYQIARRETENILRLTLGDVITDSLKQTENELMIISYQIANTWESVDYISAKDLRFLYGIGEVDLADGNGIMTDSSVPELIGFDMHSTEQGEKILDMLEDEEIGLTEESLSIRDGANEFKYSSVKLSDGSVMLIGYDMTFIHDVYKAVIEDIAANRRVLEDGMLFIVDENNNIISKRNDLNENALRRQLSSGGVRGSTGWLRDVTFEGNTYYRMYEVVEGYKFVAILKQEEVIKNITWSTIVSVVICAILFTAVFVSVSLVIRRKVVRQVSEIAYTLGRITDGDLEAQVAVHSSQEFDTISRGINSTVKSLKEHIALEAARIDDELSYAKKIQHSALPSLTGPFTDDPRFCLYALMNTAKEVGGDFYDFYMINDTTLVILIADVSGKGIPAAMCMMNGKATLHDCIMRSDDLGNDICYANGRICEGNDTGMFMTAWVGVLDLKTGVLRYVDAGHNRPVIIRGGEAAYLEMDINLLIGIMKDEDYRTQTLQLRKGDILYLYTDGVTEAMNAERNLYGDDRLIGVLNGTMPRDGDICGDICRKVTESVGDFVGDAPQADDITMLCLYYKGND